MTTDSDEFQTTPHADVDPEPPLPNDGVKRRSFLRIMGASTVPLLAEGCDTEQEPEAPAEPLRFRQLNDPTYSTPVDVQRSKSNQPILNEEEEMSINHTIDDFISLGDQVRITRDSQNYALYTVGQIRNEKEEDLVRMGLRARCRVGSGSPFMATLSTALTADGLTDAQAEAQSEFVERLVDDGLNTGLCVAAPHGGWIELHTHKQAEQITTNMANKNVTSWICKGYRQGGGAFTRWHITSTAVSPNSFAGLDAIAGRGFAYCVSFHGQSGDGIIVGGGAPIWLRQIVRDAIAAAIAGSGIDVYIATAADDFPGDSPDNFVNWLTAGGNGGIQLEQSLTARSNYWSQIASAVEGVFDVLV